MSKIITADEVKKLQLEYNKMKKLEMELEKVKSQFCEDEFRFLKKYRQGYRLAPHCPSFTIEEWNRRIVSWKSVVEEMWGKEVTDSILSETEPTHYSTVRF